MSKMIKSNQPLDLFQNDDYNENDLTQMNFSKNLKTNLMTASKKLSA